MPAVGASSEPTACSSSASETAARETAFMGDWATGESAAANEPAPAYKSTSAYESTSTNESAAVEAPTMEPGAGANKDAVHEVVRAVVAVGRASVRCIAVVAVFA